MSHSSHALELIFILGLMPRTGTNYLYTLLCLHPHVARGLAIYEDFLLRRADLLQAYARSVYASYDPAWGVTAKVGASETLMAQLGDGLLDFLRLQFAPPNPPHKQTARFCVTKTPSVENVDLFFDIFPRAPLLLLIRDGRAVVESGRRSFDWQFENATRQWVQAAQTVRRFLENPAHVGKRFLLVRYEDLFEQPAAMMGEVLDFLGLDRGLYDWARARNLPVIGSSDLRALEAGDVHWKPHARTETFKPTERFAEWTPAQHARFNHLAGGLLRYFGYAPRAETGAARYWKMWNWIQDRRYSWR